jgi:DNA (cytosine-5)-methyltransferase 1
LAGIAFPRWSREVVKACGNAIVPQVALQIFETINEYEKI